MKVPPETQRKIVLDALMKSDGNREAAAKLLGVAPRTFYRYIADLDLYPEIDKMGWTSHGGPPRGQPKGSSVVRMRILAHIRKNRGDIDYAVLTVEIYGKDGRAERQRIYSALEDLRKQGRLTITGERWVIAEDSRV